MVVPFGRCNIASTAPCLEGEGAGAFAVPLIVAATTESVLGLDGVVPLVLVPRIPAREDLRAVLTDFAFDLRVAM